MFKIILPFLFFAIIYLFGFLQIRSIIMCNALGIPTSTPLMTVVLFLMNFCIVIVGAVLFLFNSKILGIIFLSFFGAYWLAEALINHMKIKEHEVKKCRT